MAARWPLLPGALALVLLAGCVNAVEREHRDVLATMSIQRAQGRLADVLLSTRRPRITSVDIDPRGFTYTHRRYGVGIERRIEFEEVEAVKVYSSKRAVLFNENGSIRLRLDMDSVADALELRDLLVSFREALSRPTPPPAGGWPRAGRGAPPAADVEEARSLLRRLLPKVHDPEIIAVDVDGAEYRYRYLDVITEPSKEHAVRFAEVQGIESVGDHTVRVSAGDGRVLDRLQFATELETRWFREALVTLRDEASQATQDPPPDGP